MPWDSALFSRRRQLPSAEWDGGSRTLKSAEDGRDFTQLFSNRDIRDKHAVLKLTRH
jgi:hypothetical protein